MKKAVVLLLLALTGRCVQAQTPAPCDTEGHRQFHFWVGDWAVYDTSGVQVGENRVDLILNDCVLAENWTASAGSEGKSFNSYDPSTNTWSQTWVDGAGSTLSFKGHWKEDRMVFMGQGHNHQGPIYYRMNFIPQEDGSVVQHWAASSDLDEWQTLFYGIYRRKP